MIALGGFIAFVAGVIAGRIYWNKAISYARAKKQEFRSWAASEFRGL